MRRTRKSAPSGDASPKAKKARARSVSPASPRDSPLDVASAAATALAHAYAPPPASPGPPAPESNASPLLYLPSDILALVFAWLPVRPRLHTISLVCKRWRGIVVRTLQHLAIGLPRRDPYVFQSYALSVECRFAEALARFPSLTSLRLNFPTNETALHLPTQLRSLDADRSFVYKKKTLALLPPLPANLESLRIAFPEKAATFLPLLQHSATSLTSLTLTGDVLHQLRDFFASAYLPSLTSLSLSPKSSADLLHGDTFLRQHASQLITLAFHSSVARTQRWPPADVLFPRLASLTLHCMLTDADELSDYIAACPALKKLSLSVEKNAALAPLRDNTSLPPLELVIGQHTQQKANFISLLNSLPTLCSLDFATLPRPHVLEALLEHNLGGLLTSLTSSYNSTEQLTTLLSACTNIRLLHVQGGHTSFHPNATTPRLPRLLHLKFGGSLSDASTFIPKLLPLAPRLERVDFLTHSRHYLDQELSPAERTSLAGKVLQHLEAHCVGELSVTGRLDDWSEALLVSQHHGLLRMTIMPSNGS